MLRRLPIVLILLAGCQVDFGKKPIADPALAQRIAKQHSATLANPKDAEAMLALGDLYLEAERYFEAAETFKRAEAIGGDEASVNDGLSNTYLRLGYYEQAVERMKGCFKLDRNKPGCLFALGQLLEIGANEQALGEARRAYAHFLAVAPDHPKAAYVRSAIDQINVRIGPEELAPPSSQPASQPAGEAPPPPPETAASQPAGPEGVPGHGDGAAKEDVGELNPYGQAIARALDASRKNDIPGAQAAYREALKIRPDDPSARAGLAETYFAVGQIDKAVAEVGKAYDQHPGDPQVRWIFGLVMLQAGKRQKEAMAAWESLVVDFPDVAKQLGIPKRLESAKRLMPKK